jgi:hypothetical protein
MDYQAAAHEWRRIRPVAGLVVKVLGSFFKKNRFLRFNFLA